jgi:uncharacterized protein YacL
MNLSVLDDVFWAAGFIGHAALLIVLLIRRQLRKFPIFTCLIGYQALDTIALFLVSRYGTHHGYAVTYWTADVIDFLFQLALIFEIARVVLRPTRTWVRDARSSFILAGAIGAAIALILSLTVKPLSPSTLGIWEIRENLFTALLDCELFLAMLYASNRLGLEWRNHVMGLAQGLTAWAFGAVVSDMAHIILGWSREFLILDHLLMCLYLAVLVYWIFTFWRPEPKRAPLSSEMKDYLVALHTRVQYDLEKVIAVRDRK